MVNKVENVDPREVQMLEQYLKEFGQQIEAYSRQLQVIEQRRMESLAAEGTLQALFEGKEDTVLLQIGGGASLRVNVPDANKVLLNIGSDVIVEKTNTESISYLQDRVLEMEALEKKINTTIEQLQKQAKDVAKRIESAYKQMQQSQVLAGN